MSEVLWRILWIAAMMIAAAYASFIFFGSILIADADKALQKVIADDIVLPGEHHISGMIMVPSDCHGLSVKVQQTTPSSYQLAFETWREPYRDCLQIPTARSFHTITFAPSVGASFSATLDGQPFPIQLLEQYRNYQ